MSPPGAVRGEFGNWAIGQHTAQQHQIIKIHYFLHPLCNQHVPIVNEQTLAGEQHYMIRLFDNSMMLLPAWMTDAEFCAGLVLQERPQCSLSALIALRVLLDGLAL